MLLPGPRPWEPPQEEGLGASPPQKALAPASVYPSAHHRALLVFKAPLALLGKKENEAPEVNLDLLACLDPLASV